MSTATLDYTYGFDLDGPCFEIPMPVDGNHPASVTISGLTLEFSRVRVEHRRGFWGQTQRREFAQYRVPNRETIDEAS